MRNQNNRKVVPKTTRSWTSWWIDLPEWVVSFVGLSIVFLMGLLLPFSAWNLVFTFAALVIVTLAIGKSRDHWYARKKLTRQAISLLKQTPEAQKKAVSALMYKAMDDQRFVKDVRASVLHSEWTLLDTDLNIGRWVITFPSNWTDKNWNWCAFGLLTAARPYDVACTNASRLGNRIILDLSSSSDMMTAMLRWDYELSRALAVEPHELVIRVESFDPIGAKKTIVAKEGALPSKPWTETVLIEPEGVTLTLRFDGGTYFAITSKDENAQVSEYETWSAMWNTWRHFENVDAVLQRHTVA